MENIFREAEYRVVKLSDMHPADYNPRFDLQPGDINYDNLKASIMQNGLIQPLVWNPVTSGTPDFHRPRDFGVMVFE